MMRRHYVTLSVYLHYSSHIENISFQIYYIKAKFSIAQFCFHLYFFDMLPVKDGYGCYLIKNFQSTFSHLLNRIVDKSIKKTIQRKEISRLLTDNSKFCFYKNKDSFKPINSLFLQKIKKIKGNPFYFKKTNNGEMVNLER